MPMMLTRDYANVTCAVTLSLVPVAKFRLIVGGFIVCELKSNILNTSG